MSADIELDKELDDLEHLLDKYSITPQNFVDILKNSDDKNNLLLVAAKYNNTTALKQIVDYVQKHMLFDELVNNDNVGNSIIDMALLTAVSNNNYLASSYLLDCGARVDVMDSQGLYPIHCAAQEQNRDLIVLLADHGANLNAKSHYSGNTAMMLICNDYERGMIEDDRLIDLLLELGADPDIKNKRDDTAAMVVTDLRILKKLVDYGADLHGVNVDGENALFYKPTDIIRYLLENDVNPHLSNAEGVTPLHAAAIYQDGLESLKLLAKEGCSLFDKTRDGQTLLHIATLAQDIAMIEFLVDEGLDIDAKENDGLTALLYAVKSFDADTFARLIELGADHKATYKKGKGVLHLVAETPDTINIVPVLQRNPKYPFLEYILKTKLYDVNARDDEDVTPLHHAASLCDSEAISLLLLAGADVNAKENINGYKPLHHISFAHGVHMHQEFFDSVYTLCMEGNADINDRDNFYDESLGEIMMKYGDPYLYQLYLLVDEQIKEERKKKNEQKQSNVNQPKPTK